MKSTDSAKENAKEQVQQALEDQPNNVLHGVKLVDILQTLVDDLGWKELGQLIRINCFTSDPSIKSSLKFLRRTAWARNKVEALYIKRLKNK